ncbi:hypothetical protein JOF53_000986 [Crossiella equi]|uniref:Uncharacterized protein n=1 Tax=Crossiella equi TaxID=130796 RepID=A0ABS5A681_9PSEU|nr:hypothetical protein [Crossiella equi]MBP2472114.1 hypothetical protein [Crossiella equi]
MSWLTALTVVPLLLTAPQQLPCGQVPADYTGSRYLAQAHGLLVDFLEGGTGFVEYQFRRVPATWSVDAQRLTVSSDLTVQRSVLRACESWTSQPGVLVTDGGMLLVRVPLG